VLDAARAQLEGGKPTEVAHAVSTLGRLQNQRDLAPFRDGTLAAVPPDERKQWEQFWSEAASLRRRADARPGK
jgi:hypothetical protein